MEDRRQQPRRPVAWPVRLWLSEHSFCAGRAVEASSEGARLYVNWLPAGGLRPDAVYRLDVQNPQTAQTLMCAAEVRHIDGKEVGIWLREAFGLGVRVREAFPVDTLDATRPDPVLGAPPPRFTALDRRALARILVVDHDDADRELLTSALTAEGYRVTDARAGAEPVTVVRGEHPDVVLLGTGLPGLDGLAVLESIHRDNPRIGVIAIAGMEDLTIAFDSVGGGALDCLFKPVSANLLRRAVARALTTVRTAAAESTVVP
jgi:CheY-like chemotaxis protein